MLILSVITCHIQKTILNRPHLMIKIQNKTKNLITILIDFCRFHKFTIYSEIVGQFQIFLLLSKVSSMFNLYLYFYTIETS